jgi:hypothetical protein
MTSESRGRIRTALDAFYQLTADERDFFQDHLEIAVRPPAPKLGRPPKKKAHPPLCACAECEMRQERREVPAP